MNKWFFILSICLREKISGCVRGCGVVWVRGLYKGLCLFFDGEGF